MKLFYHKTQNSANNIQKYFIFLSSEQKGWRDFAKYFIKTIDISVIL